MSEIKANRTRNLRYKRSALASMGYDEIRTELDDIQGACQDIHWYIDQDNDSLINALDGEEEQAWEFKVAFSDLEAKADKLESLASLTGEFKILFIGMILFFAGTQPGGFVQSGIKISPYRRQRKASKTTYGQ